MDNRGCRTHVVPETCGRVGASSPRSSVTLKTKEKKTRAFGVWRKERMNAWLLFWSRMLVHVSRHPHSPVDTIPCRGTLFLDCRKRRGATAGIIRNLLLPYETLGLCCFCFNMFCLGMDQSATVCCSLRYGIECHSAAQLNANTLTILLEGSVYPMRLSRLTTPTDTKCIVGEGEGFAKEPRKEASSRLR